MRSGPGSHVGRFALGRACLGRGGKHASTERLFEAFAGATSKGGEPLIAVRMVEPFARDVRVVTE